MHYACLKVKEHLSALCRTKICISHFDQGSQLSDPNKILEGKGKQMRHIKIYQEQDIDEKNVADFIKESYLLD